MGVFNFLKKKGPEEKIEEPLAELPPLPPLEEPSKEEIPALKPEEVEPIEPLKIETEEAPLFEKKPEEEKIDIAEILKAPEEKPIAPHKEVPKEPIYEPHTPSPKELELPKFEGVTKPKKEIKKPPKRILPAESKKELLKLNKGIPSVGPLFIDLESFRYIASELEDIEKMLKQSSEQIANLFDTFYNEEKALETWSDDMEAVQENLMYIDQALFEKKGKT